MIFDSRIDAFKIVDSELRTTIRTPLWIAHLFLPILVFTALLYSFTLDGGAVYLFPILAVCLALLYRIWKLFDPINIITADKKQRVVLIRTRNIIKRALTKTNQIAFSKIKNFSITQERDTLMEPTRFIITARTSEGDIAILTHTTKKRVAENLVAILHKATYRENSSL